MLKSHQFWLSTDGPRWLWFDFWLCSKVQQCSKSWKGSPLLQNPAYVLLHARVWAKFMLLPWQPPFADNCPLWLCQVSAEAGVEELGGRCWAAESTEGLGTDTAPRINWESGKCDGTLPQVSAQSSRRRRENGRSYAIFCSYFSWDIFLWMLVHMHTQRWDLGL